jgi:tRNA(adenine34) deaminase
MRLALHEATLAAAEDAVPVGVVVVDDRGVVVVCAHNSSSSPTHHAEILAIEQACHRLNLTKLTGFTLVTTLEPCIMCAGAILNAQIDQVVFAAWDDKFGASGSVWDLLRDPRSPHHPQVYSGVLSDESSKLLTNFFCELRNSAL